MLKTAGILFFISGSTILLGILTAEIFYPNYSISLNMISNLGSTAPPHSIIKEPSARIFDFSIFASGILILLGTYSFKKNSNRLLTISLLLMGLGVGGVGLFPAFTGHIHLASALLGFLFGSISAILSFQIIKGPFRYFALIFGLVGLTFLITGLIAPRIIVPILGPGGTERWVAYPLILWLVGFGGYLMNSKK